MSESIVIGFVCGFEGVGVVFLIIGVMFFIGEVRSIWTWLLDRSKRGTVAWVGLGGGWIVVWG